jgi:antitoxin component YwqK of YwqJK toxin-antitoxin module
MKMERVNIDELDSDYTEGGSIIYIWEGRPFTGIAYELNRDGNLVNETSYVEGIEDGLKKDWYPNGQPKSSTEMKWNRPHGNFTHWHVNGQKKYEGVAELGHDLNSQEWDESGKLINEYQIESDPKELASLETDRLIFKKYGLI